MIKDLKLFQELAELLLEEEQNNPVAKPIATDLLYHKLDLSLNDKGIVDEELKDVLSSIIRTTPKTASKLFFNQLFGGRIGKAALGDLLAVLLNNSMYTYKVAGPQVGIEKVILKEISARINYGNNSDGTFASGGSMTNYIAMLMARDRFDPSIRTEGYTKKLVAYTSESSHYSIEKNASFLGIGRHQIRKIASDNYGKMIPEKLQKCIADDLNKGYHPFFVNATAGTTVLGAFDDIYALSQVCNKNDIWLHVDGAYCGSVIFSNNYKHLINGIEFSDSFSVNAHKMLGTPLTSSIILTKDKKHLHDSLSNDADYLYQTDGDDFNLGKTSLQCGRRNNALKLWTLWKSVGHKGLEKIVDKQFYLAKIAREYIKSNESYKLYSFDDSISVCFNYKDIPAKLLCTELYENSELMVGFGQFKGQEFVRLVTINSTLQEEDIKNFFSTLERYVRHKILK
ncbi:pyridoxal-dependent decarboxylase [Ichthyenterobacterium sp. W332]|uniref:Pyridoxal-dependent decarboxylase n=1 Tax=Microcosmobacter mediterraneus TaxID=3075607 RepID=A0ABU2YNT9_9FLAO|nr:pyridoxal-dependent decarboxylase [Ichthyenterobacterium sp. W332]MDT0559349.1 pyridoxal-dependent decarboxylase [Ichthyenterobacterium sp. W332]